MHRKLRRHPFPRAATVLTAFVGCLLAALVVIPADDAGAAPPRYVASDKTERAALPPPPGALRVPLNCDAALDTVTVALGLVDTLRSDTTGGPTQVPAYPCAPWDETGPEAVVRLEVTEELVVRATLSDLGEVDLDLFLLDACNSDACVAAANLELAARLLPGTYFLVVDGYQGAAGPFTLALASRYPGVPPEICDDTGFEFVSEVNEAQNGEVLDQNTLFGAINRLEIYDCSPVIERGGENWYAITLPDSGEVSVDFSDLAATLDLAVWLFDGCGLEAVCLAFADARPAGGAEQLEWQNLTGSSTTVYLAVDCFRAPADEFSGYYYLGLDLVATERTSFSDLKSRFR